ncbi:hypothetical protein KGF86_09370 [Ornithinibacillus massiliensis]|uniref:Uncharacterized protein n=1 Tax=Ornithinibacillus massiliensis TaxID=1944633 RepID=A0ABS5MDM1_9BACI|nr:hypothetical protein [Ornithinibacillus massiliensis]MBS3680424.1 hypothetical protein [Ornithinibacillus massiliensis]
MVRMSLELVRIIFLLALFGVVGGYIIGSVYTTFQISSDYSLFGSIGILFLFFVLYRNKLQFSGWYNGLRRNKLSRTITNGLIMVAVFLMIIPFILSWLNYHI